MDEKMKIHVLIDNERFPLTIHREDEWLYRNAAKQVNDKLNAYREECHKRGLQYSKERYLAMVAFDLAFHHISLKDRNDTDPYREKLTEWVKEMEELIE